MRFLTILFLSCLLSISAFAQRGGRGGGGGGGARSSGFGRSSGGFARAGSIGYSRGGYGFGYGRGSYGYGRGYGYRGYRGFYGFGLGLGYYGGYNPYYYGGYYGSYYPYFDYGFSSYTPYYLTPTYGYDSQPQVSINQTAPPPLLPPDDQPAPQYSQASRPNDASDYKPTLYLIALRDHNIKPALTYWVERGTLHYVTMEHEMREIPISTVDRELSERLNRERHMSFRLPVS